jgi:hypothetical protein
MWKPQTEEGHLGNWDKDNCKENALGKALSQQTSGSHMEPSRVFGTRLEQDSNSFHALLEEEGSTLQGGMAWCSSICPGTLKQACMRIHTMATPDLH